MTGTGSSVPRRWWLLRVTMHVLEHEAAEREQLGALLNGGSS
jgi:hypothetical protein